MNKVIEKIKQRGLKFKRLLKFYISGGLALIANLGLLYLLTETAGIHYILSASIAMGIAILIAFLFNEYWTFKDRRNSEKNGLLDRCVKFYSLRVGTMFFSIAILFVLTEFLGVYYMISRLVPLVVIPLLNYKASLDLIWR